MRKFTAFMGVLVVALFAAGLVIGATVPEKVTIKEIQKAKAPVEFNHKAHGEKLKDCKTCHHKDDTGKEQKCSTCHKPKMANEKESFKDVMHTKCKGCHQKEKMGPTKCDDCHKK